MKFIDYRYAFLSLGLIFGTAQAGDPDAFEGTAGNKTLTNPQRTLDVHSQADENVGFMVNVKGVINSDGTRQPYSSYRHALDNFDNPSWLASQPFENRRPFSLAWSADQQRLYGVSREEARELIMINPETAEATVIGKFTGMIAGGENVQGIAIDENNTCYISATDNVNHDTISTLYRCDLSSGALTLVGSQSTAPDLHDIAATCDGRMYGINSASGELYEVDKQDGGATLVGALGTHEDQGLFSLTYDRKHSDLYQYVISTSGVHTAFGRISQNTGELTFVSELFRFGIYVGAVQSSCDEQVETFQLNAGFNGAWINPATPGQGLMIDLYPDTDVFFAAWFTFAVPDAATGATRVGSVEQRWMTASGVVGDRNRVELTLYNSTGGVFDDPAAVDTSSVGSMIVEFDDCSNGTVKYSLFDSDLSGEFSIQRVAGDNVALCEQLLTGDTEG